MKEVEVFSAWELKPHNSFSSAVSAAKNKDIDEKALKEINGSIVVDYFFHGDFLTIKFANEKCLDIWPGSDRVHWCVSECLSKHATNFPSERVMLVFSDGEKSEWCWKSILDDFVGKQAALSPSDQCLFIFYRGGAEYMISVLAETNKPSKKILYIAES